MIKKLKKDNLDIISDLKIIMDDRNKLFKELESERIEKVCFYNFNIHNFSINNHN